MIDPRWKDVICPGSLRNQFREQFGEKLLKHMPPIEDPFRETRVPEILHAFDMADQHIGKHWPFLATNLWRYGSHVLISAYFETSGTVFEAMQGIFSTTTAIYPVFRATSEITADGLLVRSQPTFALDARHWEIFQIMTMLAQSALFKNFAPEETKGIRIDTSVVEDDYADTLRKITTCKINFGVRVEDTVTLFPFDLLQKKISHRNSELNKILFAELEKQTQLPEREDNIMFDLRRSVYNHFPKILSSSDAASLLNMSRSTFHRVLRKRGTTFRKVAHELRREFVLSHIGAHTDERTCYLALGFSSQRALSSFCKTSFEIPLQKLIKQKT